jgi:hypothetical protein
MAVSFARSWNIVGNRTSLAAATDRRGRGPAPLAVSRRRDGEAGSLASERKAEGVARAREAGVR